MTALNILKKYWNHNSFRNSQEKIIETVLARKEVIALLPTGGGKSICYQIPALILDGVCIVISPLIALMNDQVNSLTSRGIKAIAITSKLSESEIIIAFDNMMFGNIKFLYLSPEKLKSALIQQKISQLNVNLIAIDEAHCISEWGHDFRPSYLEINKLRELHPKTPFIALTATATKKVLIDIEKYLDLINPILFKDSFDRPNLAYQVIETENILFKLKQLFHKIKAPAIIYASTRKKTKEISDYLNRNSFKSSFYHGGLSFEEKEKSFQNWMSETNQIMVATNAFGMGIDKDNVKVVIHIDLPYSIENYVQEAGRAGRNGKKAFALLLYNEASIFDFKNRIHKSTIRINDVKNIYNLLNQHLRIAYGELSERKYKFDLQEFCHKYNLSILSTSNIIGLLEKEGILALEENFKRKNNLRFICNQNVLKAYRKTHTKSNELIQLLLRTYGGVFEQSSNINETYLSKQLQTNKQAIILELKQLHRNKIIHYKHTSNLSEILFLVMREDTITINSITKNIRNRNTTKLKNSNALLTYINNNEICKNKQLLIYFDNITNMDCGICNVCLNLKKNTSNKLIVKNNILTLFDENRVLSAKEIVLLLDQNEVIILQILRVLLEQKVLKKTEKDNYIKR